MKKPKRPPLVLVSWLDSHFTNGWQNLRDVDVRPSRCKSVGWLVKKTKRTLTLAQSRSDEMWGEFITIPRGAVRRVRRLESKR